MNTAADPKFWSMVQIGRPDECWPWKGALGHFGYGHVKRNGRQYNAHTYAYKITKGDPCGMPICHRCDNPPCCNPAHLWKGTSAENVQDCIQKGRRPTCKLTWEVVAEIRAALREGERNADVARRFGIDKSIVSRIRTNRAWSLRPAALPAAA